MKRVLFLSLILLGLTACDKDKPVVKPVEGKISLKSETSIVLSDDADSKQATFSATLAWTAASSESWLSVEPGSGEAGDATITISAGKNENYDPRTATVTLTCDKDTKTIQVTQKQKGALLLTESTIPVGAEGGTVVIVAKANANVSASIDAAAKEWISDITTKALTDYSFQFEVKANESEEARSGNIVFSNEYGSETVTIEQAAQTPANVFGEVTYVSGSSSSLVFGWTTGGTAAEDAEVPYKLELFKDAACSDLQVSFDIPADHSCWDGKDLRFTFGGLQPATKYWFKVTNMQNGDVSDPVEGTTEAFTVVDPSTVTNAAVGDVILAEDFSEIGWGADMLANAAGFIPSGKPLDLLSGNYTTDDGNFLDYDNTSGRIYGETRVTSDKRLYNWGFFGNSSVYSYAGYLRVGSSSSGARTHIVSPALSGIPEGMTATVDVTVTSSVYNSGADVAVFVNDHSTLTLVLAPDQKESTNPKFSSSGGKYTGASLSDGYPLYTDVNSWTTKTIRI